MEFHEGEEMFSPAITCNSEQTHMIGQQTLGPITYFSLAWHNIFEHHLAC